MSSSQERAAQMSFVERHGLWTDEQFAAAAKAERLIEENRLEIVRLSFADQHGILRGKTAMAADAARTMRNGCTVTTTLLAKDTSHRTVLPVFSASCEMACSIHIPMTQTRTWGTLELRGDSATLALGSDSVTPVVICPSIGPRDPFTPCVDANDPRTRTRPSRASRCCTRATGWARRP